MPTIADFAVLKTLEGRRVRLVFEDGEQVIATLFAVTTDMDGSQHVIYENTEWITPDRAIDKSRTYYTEGEMIARFEAV